MMARMLDLAAAAGFVRLEPAAGFLATALGFFTRTGVTLLIQLLALSRVKASNFLSTSATCMIVKEDED